MNSLRTISYTAVFTLCLSLSAPAQIAQDKPELCGKKNEFVALPNNISATQGETFSTLFLRTSRSDAPVAIRAVMSNVTEVCQVSRDRLLVFGDTGTATSLVILDQKAVKVIDQFFAYDPVVSPNQHWIAFRDFYAPQSEIPMSEEYLIYDLAKDKAGNRLPNPDSSLETTGRVIYPVVQGGVPFLHGGLSENQTHRFRSDSLYWSDDSRSVVFADSVRKALSIVVVTIDGVEPQAREHKLTSAEACEQGLRGDLLTADLFLSRASFSPSGIGLQFRSSDFGACTPIPLTLTAGDFISSVPEGHNPPYRDHSTMKQQ